MTPPERTSRPTLEDLADVINAESEALSEQLVLWRRDLHAHPETSWHENRTTARIRGVLEALGLEPQGLGADTGLMVDITPPRQRVSPRVGLRADIDALPIQDTKDVPYRSTQDGVTHACGHDVHTAGLLGAAVVLTKLRDRGMLTRGVRLFFQAAEETSPGGALDIIEAGGLDGLRGVYALHCDPRTEVGKVAIRAGSITSACDKFAIRFAGPGGHSSRPHLTSDLVAAMGAVICEVPNLLSRRIDPRAGASMVWGRVEAGNAPNAIPSTGFLGGTLRCLDLEGWQQARELVPQLVEQIVAPYGVKAEVDRAVGIPPTVNHTVATSRMAEVCGTLLGAESIAETEQSLGGEDFSEMVLRVPGALGRLGVRPIGVPEWPDLHRPAFDVDEACLPVAVKVLTGLVAHRG